MALTVYLGSPSTTSLALNEKITLIYFAKHILLIFLGFTVQEIDQHHKHIKTTLDYWLEPCSLSSVLFTFHLVLSEKNWSSNKANCPPLIYDCWNRFGTGKFFSTSSHLLLCGCTLVCICPPIPFNTHKGIDSNFR